MKKTNKQEATPVANKLSLIDQAEGYFGLLVLMGAAFRGIQLQVTRDQNIAVVIAGVIVVFSALAIVKITRK